MYKKIITSILLLSILLSVASCNNNSSNDVNSEHSESTNFSSTDTVSEETTISDNVPPANYNGYQFRILTRSNYFQGCRHIDEVFVEESNGDILNDAVYRRNLTICERFNIEIVPVIADEADESNLTKQVLSSVNAGDDTFDIALGHTSHMSGLSTSGALRNWYDIPNIDFSKPWWLSSATKALTIDGKSYYALCELAYTYYDFTYNIFFNKTLATNYNMPNMYELVLNKGWTIDKLGELTKDIYLDLNGSGKSDWGDLYGYGGLGEGFINSYYWALGGKIAEIDKNNSLKLVMNNEKTVQIIDKLYDLCYNAQGSYVVNSKRNSGDVNRFYAPVTMLIRDQAVFVQSRLLDCYYDLRYYEGDYGILPLPMFDENQDKYRTQTDAHSPIMAVPVTIENIERTGSIIEALSAESYKTVTPAYYEIALKNKYSRDEESSKMIDLIRDGITFDFGFMYNGSGLSFLVSQIIDSGRSDFVSAYEKKETAAIKYYENILEQYK